MFVRAPLAREFILNSQKAPFIITEFGEGPSGHHGSCFCGWGAFGHREAKQNLQIRNPVYVAKDLAWLGECWEAMLLGSLCFFGRATKHSLRSKISSGRYLGNETVFEK